MSETIQHWAREGVRIYDETSLLERSEMCDARSRGSSTESYRAPTG